MESKKVETAKRIAEAHFGVEPNLQKVYLLEPLGQDDDEEPVKLLEVVEGSLSQGIYPIGFAPDPENGICYRSVIVEISPKEWIALREIGFFSVRGRKWTIGDEILPSKVAA